MSTGFCCGSFGCLPFKIDDDAAQKAEHDRFTWATEQKHKTGKFPSRKEQMLFVEAAYNRHTQIKVHDSKTTTST